MVNDYYLDENIYTTGAESMFALVAIVLLVYLILMGLAITKYIMTSLALFKIADRRNIPNPWMAWIPFLSDWIIGYIVDDYDERNGMKRKWKVVLLTLSLVAVGGFIIGYIVLFIGILFLSIQFVNTEPDESIIAFMLILYLFLIIMAIIATAKSFCKTVCMYKIYESTLPEKAVKYLLLSLLVPLAGAICLLKCKDKGYPYPIPPTSSEENFETIQGNETVVGEQDEEE